MQAVDKTNGATLANGALSFAYQVQLSLDDDFPAGTLQDVYSVAFEIFDSVYSVVQAKTALNTTTDRISKGRYAATWAPGSAVVGQYFVRWFYKAKSADAEKSFDQEFELVQLPYTSSHYCTVYDLVDMGLPSTVTAAEAQRMIILGSKYAETYTGRGPFAFDPQFKTIEVDGSSARAILLGEPIVALEGVKMTIVSAFGQSNLSIISQALRIYNRHLTSNLTIPDDRQSPKVEFIHGDDLNGIGSASTNNTASGYRLDTLVWPRGNKNAQFVGLFGYTEWDGSFVGCTPIMLREIVKLLVFRNIVERCGDDREARQRGYRMTQENTRDQGFQYAQPWLKGWITGDPEIDQLLLTFSRPPMFGAA